MPGPRGLVQCIDQELHQSGLLPRGRRLLVAVSGGADSVALLRLLDRINQSDYWNWKLVVGHVDHGIRGKASREDARFVKALARTMGLPYIVRELKLKAGASEDAARRGRLAALQGMVRAKKCVAVVMAHHADDQAETILLRMMRGCGIDGLAGIAAESRIGKLWICRPLLGVRRIELRDFLAQSSQPWREDASNVCADYLRNRVRATVMPMLNVIWPRAVEALGRLGTLAGQTQQVVDDAVADFLKRHPMRVSRGAISLPRRALREQPVAVASEVLRLGVKLAGRTFEAANFERIQEALRLARGTQGGKRVELGRGIVLTVDGDRIRISRGTNRRVRR